MTVNNTIADLLSEIDSRLYGKRYKRRDGKITEPLMSCDSETYPFTDGNITWKSNGAYYVSERANLYDLIEEVI